VSNSLFKHIPDTLINKAYLKLNSCFPMSVTVFCLLEWRYSSLLNDPSGFFPSVCHVGRRSLSADGWSNCVRVNYTVKFFQTMHFGDPSGTCKTVLSLLSPNAPDIYGNDVKQVVLLARFKIKEIVIYTAAFTIYIHSGRPSTDYNWINYMNYSASASNNKICFACEL